MLPTILGDTLYYNSINRHGYEGYTDMNDELLIYNRKDMKKLFLMMSILLSTSMFYACSSDDEMNVNGGGGSKLIPDDGVVLTPFDYIELRDYAGSSIISEFFDKELPKGTRSNSFFINSDQDECFVINSIQELKSIYKGNKEVPNIDFDRYTLVIGQLIDPDAYDPVMKQDLMFKDHKCHLTLYVPNLDGVSLNGVNYKTQYLYHWALYPKFSTEAISVGYVKNGNLRSIKDAGFKDTGWLSYIPSLGRWRIACDIPDDATHVGFCYNYFPMNLPDEFKVELDHFDFYESRYVSISGYIFEMGDEYQSDPIANNVYLTEINEIDSPALEIAEMLGINYNMLDQ